MLATKRTPLWPDWRRKPEPGTVTLNRDHPLSRGLVGCWLFNERAGARMQDLAGIDGDLLADATNPTGWVAAHDGVAVSATPEAPQFAATPAATPYVHEISFIARVYQGYEPSNYGASIAAHADPDLPGDWFCYIQKTSQLLAVDVPNVGGGVVGSTALSITTPYTIGFTRRGASDPWTWQGYVNGVLDGSRVDGANDQTPEKLTIGNVLSPGVTALAWARHYHRALSDDEMAWLHAEPYAGLVPIRRRRYFTGTGGGPTAFPHAYYQRRRAS